MIQQLPLQADEPLGFCESADIEMRDHYAPLWPVTGSK